MQLSVVVPLYNEEESVGPLVEAVRAALPASLEWELLLVDDGSRDGTVASIGAFTAADPRVRLVPLARNYGQTQAMQAGFDAAEGDVVVSMDGDLQNDPQDIPRLLATLEQGYDLVAGYRQRRQDDLVTRKIPSWIANRAIRAVTGVDIRDNGCSLKAYRRWTLDRMDLYSDMHRFLPALAAATAGARITEIPVRHHSRRYGHSKYGLSRVLKILADLLTITMIMWFRERPLTLFGTAAIIAFAIGAGFLTASAVAIWQIHAGMATAFVLPASGLLCILLGCYLLMLGLVAQVFLHHTRQDRASPPPIAVERFA
ncbi:MAG TPA: glycosyltransferase family 2 protein [Gemmatimonadales bacterium]|nr:glycosyltransferase family 2 protein [Gemmatimonadales bacterium]